MESKREQISEIEHRAALRPPSVPSFGLEGQPKRLAPAETSMDRLWRMMGNETRCQWLDRDVQYVTFWFDLPGNFASDFHPEDANESFSIKLTGPTRSFGLTTNLGLTHMAKICFVHQKTFHLRTNLPPALLELLKQVDAAGVPTAPLTLELRRRSKPGPTARRFGTCREFRIGRASGPIGF